MYIIAGSTGTLGTAIVDALSKDNELFLIGRDETKLKEQALAINADYQVIDPVSYTHLTLPTTPYV